MRIPDWWQFVVLTLATYRVCRLLGWDDWPPVAKARAWLLGERFVAIDNGDALLGGPEPDFEPRLPGKTPESEVGGVRPAYDRPLLAHLVHCPFCLGFWVACGWYAAWLAWQPVMYGATLWALAGAASLVAKNWDP